METIYADDEGIKLILNVVVDISDSTSQSIKYKKPNNDRGSWVASRESNTSISYIIQKGDIDGAGIWKLQASVETPNWKLSGKEASLKVLGKLA